VLIDWFTVGAQALNFLILVWLMKRFLYKPVLDAIDAREKRIDDQIADATAKQAQAEADRVTFQGKSDAFDKDRSALLNKATSDAQNEGKRLMDEARQAADALRAERKAALAAEMQQTKEAIAEKTMHEVFALSKKALADLASQDLEVHIIDVFLTRLSALSEAAKAVLGDALKAASETAVVSSAFVMEPKQRTAVQATFNQVFKVELPLRFEVAADKVGGIELSVGGQKLAWSISNYLASLEEEVTKALAPAEEGGRADKSADEPSHQESTPSQAATSGDK
jgi:F-type H+-transporting ATPase subunit b